MSLFQRREEIFASASPSHPAIPKADAVAKSRLREIFTLKSILQLRVALHASAISSSVNPALCDVAVHVKAGEIAAE
jgi:hypothetical protein